MSRNPGRGSLADRSIVNLQTISNLFQSARKRALARTKTTIRNHAIYAEIWPYKRALHRFSTSKYFSAKRREVAFRLTRDCGWNRRLFCPVYKAGPGSAAAAWKNNILVVVEGLWTAGKDFVRPWGTADPTVSLTFMKAWKKTSFKSGVDKGCHPARIYMRCFTLIVAKKSSRIWKRFRG